MKILIVFGSLLGKTKRLAVLAGTELRKKGFDVKVKDVVDTNINELEYFDLVIFGCSTWDDGMLQFDFREFFKVLVHSQFTDKNFAVFGLGSHKYPHFCTAPDIIAGAISAAKGKLIVENLKLDLDHDEPIDKCDNELVEWIHKIEEKITR